MKIIYLDKVDSTQKYLKERLKQKKLISPVCIYSDFQTNGIGSRGNIWVGIKGNLFFSFSLKIKDLPNDLKIESSSIYFSYILKEILQNLGSKVWIKWPNDFYMDDKKIGGVITEVIKDDIICGIGLNLKNAPDGFGVLDIAVDKKELIEKFLKNLKNLVSWKQVFRKYEVEFYKSKIFLTNLDNKKQISLKDAKLLDDGSLEINGERIYSLR